VTTFDNFPNCKMDFRIVTPCAPVSKSTGRVTLNGSTPYFADSGLGDEAIVNLRIGTDERVDLDRWITLTWIDWDEFEYASVQL
jgi:hypothetical protein